MTRLDLRIKYRFEMGLSPTHGKDRHVYAGSYTYNGGLTKEYTEWLEGNQGKERQLKYRYDTGELPTFKKRENGELVTKYLKDYKEWLEDFMLNYLKY